MIATKASEVKKEMLLTETFYYVHATAKAQKRQRRDKILKDIKRLEMFKICTHLTTSPIGLNPWLSRKLLRSLKLMKSCVVLVFFPAVANTTVPFLLETRTGSSRRLFLHLACTSGLCSLIDCTFVHMSIV